MQGWPDGLMWNGKGGWSAFAGLALSRLFIEGRLYFFKKVPGQRSSRDCGLTKQDLQRVLQETKKYEMSVGRLRLQLNDEGGDHLDGAAQSYTLPTDPGEDRDKWDDSLPDD